MATSQMHIHIAVTIAKSFSSINTNIALMSIKFNFDSFCYDVELPPELCKMATSVTLGNE